LNRNRLNGGDGDDDDDDNDDDDPAAAKIAPMQLIAFYGEAKVSLGSLEKYSRG